MCLTEVYSDEDMWKIIEEMPEVAPGIVVLDKGVEIGTGHYINYHSDCTYRCSYRNGINKASPKWTIGGGRCKYWPYYHFYYGDMPEWFASYKHQSRIKCLVKKDWITAIGKETSSRKFIGVVASQAFFPTYPETEAKLEDFLAWQEQQQEEVAEVEV